MRWPPATEIAVPVVIVPPMAPAPTSTAAPDSVISEVASRAASGSSRMRSPSTTSETAIARSSTWSSRRAAAHFDRLGELAQSRASDR